MIYIPSFVKIGSGIRKLIRGNTHSQNGDLVKSFFFFQNMRRKLNTEQITWNMRYVYQIFANVSHQRFYDFLKNPAKEDLELHSSTH
jgi:hypothetical protein